MELDQLKSIIVECIEEFNFGQKNSIPKLKPKIGIKKPRKKFPNWMDPTNNNGIQNPTRSSFDIFKSRQKYNSKPTMTGTSFKGISGKKRNKVNGRIVNLKRKISGGRI